MILLEPAARNFPFRLYAMTQVAFAFAVEIVKSGFETTFDSSDTWDARDVGCP
jgi:hypothetical protein